jgi:eukaryotic sulfide quinone oxidoreductase
MSAALRSPNRVISTARRWASTDVKDKYKIVVVGAGLYTVYLCNIICHSFITGTGGLSAAQQIYDRFSAAQQGLNAGDIAILDSAEYHYYQVSSIALLLLYWV